MKDIKTKEHNSKPKTRNPVSRMPKELVRTTLLELKEKSHQITHMKDSEVSTSSTTEYGGEKLESAEAWVLSKAGEAATAAGQKVVKKSYEKIKQRKSAERTAQEMGETTREVAGGSGVCGRDSTGTPSFSLAGERKKEVAKESAKKATEQTKIRVKTYHNRLPSTEQKYSVKKAPPTVKTSCYGGEISRIKAKYTQSRQAVKGMQAAKKGAEKSIHAVKNTAKATKTTAKGALVGIKAAAAAVKSMFVALGAVGGGIALLLVLMLGIIGGVALSGSSSSAEPLSAEVLAYTSTIQKYASQYGIPEYVQSLQAIMMQESGGRGSDPMQSSECPFNTRFPNSPGAITDPEYSIEVGVQYYAACVQEAGCENPYDMDKLKLSWQGYNYGNGYISWALRKFGGYSAENALQFSQEQAASHGWSGYGDPEYVPHVQRYYAGGNIFGGLFGNDQIVTIAKAQLGNEGGQKFWSWYGFQGRVEWCACFVSWCANEAGYIESGVIPKFSGCVDGENWFKGRSQWQDKNYTPSSGDIIFFDWEGEGTTDHVGIVEKLENGTVYTVEGNSSDACRQRSYPVGSSVIYGYGTPQY